MPVVSLVLDPRFLWDDSIGIYIVGKNGCPGPWDAVPKNFYRDWNRAGNIEYFGTDGAMKFNQGAGIGIAGNYTRSLAQKSLDINFDAKYGKEKLKYVLFSSKPNVNEFNSLFLRNSGNDWKYDAAKWRGCMFKDALIHTLALGQMDIDCQAYQPAVLYINGQYWGIQNFREKLDENFVGENYKGIDRDSIDMIKQGTLEPWEVVAGDTSRYNRLLEYLSSHDMSVESNYNYIKTQMDIRNFINYQIVETYSCNNDWPHNNQKEWCPWAPGYKWHWMLYDTDPGMGGTVYTGPEVNMMDQSFNSSTSWASLVISKLIINTEFRYEFGQTYAAHLNTTYDPTRVKAVVDSLKNKLAAEMPSQINRWKAEANAIPSITQWQTDVQLIKNFADQRPAYAWQHMKTKCSLVKTETVTLTVNSPVGGRVFIQGARVNGPTLSGPFFSNIPIEFLAKANNGYAFVKWEITNNGIHYFRTDSLLQDTITGPYTIIAHFNDGQSLRSAVQNNFSAFPNPVSDILQIENLEYSGPVSITIFAADGRNIRSITTRFDQSLFIPVEDLPAGLYLAKITAGNTTEVLRIIKK